MVREISFKIIQFIQHRLLERQMKDSAHQTFQDKELFLIFLTIKHQGFEILRGGFHKFSSRSHKNPPTFRACIRGSHKCLSYALNGFSVVTSTIRLSWQCRRNGFLIILPVPIHCCLWCINFEVTWLGNVLKVNDISRIVK